MIVFHIQMFALNFSLLENKKEFRKRTTPPGQHGAKRKRFSVHALQNREQKKLQLLYSWRGRQLYNLFAKLKKKRGNIGDNLLIVSESRLDNLVFRSQLVKTRRMARQLVNHNHFLLNGKKVNIPSYEVKPGSVISLKKPIMKENKIIRGCLEQNNPTLPYICLDKEKLTITYLRYPLPEELNKDIDTSLVAE
ncbi:21709_t:CDS:2 [Gigaspora margarita]|uniref:21709_t:CDS:1 n=1 Tax=Gigaspora margarita TaxID=4874 RepID=A0ABM8VV84_GIGMA|nr:21709_t:CDS:2 [Gigaspora margarita]